MLFVVERGGGRAGLPDAPGRARRRAARAARRERPLVALARAPDRAAAAPAGAAPREGRDDLPARREPVVAAAAAARAGRRSTSTTSRPCRSTTARALARAMRDMAALLQPRPRRLRHAAVAVRFVYPMVSLEGRAWWMLRTAPIALETHLVEQVLDRLRAARRARRGAGRGSTNRLLGVDRC